MWKTQKIEVEQLDAVTFAPYGHVIRSFEERKPDKVKGDYATAAYTVSSECSDPPKDGPGWYEPNKDRVPISEGLQRAHFAFHTPQSSPSFTARVIIPLGSEPWSGSVSPKQPIASPRASRGSQARRWASVPKAWIGNITREL